MLVLLLLISLPGMDGAWEFQLGSFEEATCQTLAGNWSTPLDEEVNVFFVCLDPEDPMDAAVLRIAPVLRGLEGVGEE